MKRGVRAFTIVEFTIAIAVATILGAAAIARYNTFSREQEFEAGGQQIANCLSRANLESRAGGKTNPPRFVRATISYDAATPRVDCVVESHLQYRADGSPTTVTQLLAGNPAEGTTSQAFRAENASLAGSASIIRLVYGGLESGMPLGMSGNAVATRQPDNNAVGTYVPFGKGFALDATTNVIRLNSSSTALCGFVSATNLGTPVRFQLLPACS